MAQIVNNKNLRRDGHITNSTTEWLNALEKAGLEETVAIVSASSQWWEPKPRSWWKVY